MIVHDAKQGTPEWIAIRAGKLTSSAAGDMVAEVSSGEAAARRNLRIRLAIERITGGGDEDGFTSRPMQRGHELEPMALGTYEAITGNFVSSCGFVEMEGIAAGASPDGVIGDFDGIVEVKCPLAAEHLRVLRGGKIKKAYEAQCAHLLWVTGAEWCDWVSYHPRFPKDLRLKRVRFSRNVVDEYEAKAREFLGEVDYEVKAIRELSSFPPEGAKIGGGSATREDAGGNDPAVQRPANDLSPKQQVEALCERDSVPIEHVKAWLRERLALQRVTSGAWETAVDEWERVLASEEVAA